MMKFQGAITALTTPFKGGEIDRASLKRLVQFQLENGIEGLVVNGTTAESPTLTPQEVEEIFGIVKAEAGSSVPILVGTGLNSTQKTIEASIKAEKMGADGLLVVTPYYNKPPQRGMFLHFKAVAESVEIPVVLYNVPGRTAVSLSPETTEELSRLSNVVGIKDATGDMKIGQQILEKCGSDFTVTSGDDGTFLDLALMGGTGVISVLSNVAPKQTVNFLKRARRGDRSVIQEFADWQEFVRLLFVEANPIPVKYALNAMGLFEKDEMRLPLVPLDSRHREPLLAEMKRLGVHR